MRTLLLLFVLLAGQRPAFEVASIRPAQEMPERASVGIHFSGAQARIVYFSLRDYIGLAYQVKPNQIVGPESLAARFDIAGKLPEGATQSQVPEMLQSLLEERFQMKMHREMREFPVYTLEVGKNGTALKPSTTESVNTTAPVSVAATGSAQGVVVDLGQGAYLNFGDNRFEAIKVTTEQLAEGLSRFVNRPIIDGTKMQGRYDFKLDVSREDYGAMMVQSAVNAGVNLPPQALRVLDTATFESVFAAFEKLGLRLVAGKAPLEVIVVDNILKMPTGN